MSKPRTQQEIETEIKALEECKAFVPHHSKFGENNHKKIDLAIEELRDGFDDTAEEWDEMDDWERDAISEAKNWKNGEEDESPSSGWQIFRK
jgi:hypothetical protein